MPMPDVPHWVKTLPHLNASLNAISASLLIAGYRSVRKGNIERHRKAMIAALCASALFLASYLTYHFYPGVGSIRFENPAWFRPVYLSILIPHIILAVPVAPAALALVYLAGTRRIEAHRRLAKIALPVWLFVSASGVAVYLILYAVFPQV